MRAAVDAWAAARDDEPGRSEAIRRLVELGLKVKSVRWTPLDWKRQHQAAGVACCAV